MDEPNRYGEYVGTDEDFGRMIGWCGLKKEDDSAIKDKVG